MLNRDNISNCIVCEKEINQKITCQDCENFVAQLKVESRVRRQYLEAVETAMNIVNERFNAKKILKQLPNGKLKIAVYDNNNILLNEMNYD